MIKLFSRHLLPWLGCISLIQAGWAQPVVVDSGTTNTFSVSSAATNFAWTLDGVAVGGNSNSFAYKPQVYDVGTHYLLAEQILPGGVNSNSYWAVRVRIPLPTSGANYYVATNGSDVNPGTIASPFRTLEKARDTIRALSRPLPAGGVTVWLRGGTHVRTNSLMLTNANDSGSVTAPIVWRSYSNEVAVLFGGKTIAATNFASLNSSQTNRLAPGVNPTNIWEINITNAAILHATTFPTDFNQWTTFNVYNQGSDGGLCELLYNGQRQFLSRYPNHDLTNDDLLTTNLMMDGVAKGRVNPGTTLIYTGDSTNSLNYPGTYTNSAGTTVSVGGAFYCKSNDVARFTRWQTAITNGSLWLQGYWRIPWQIDGLKVIGFDVTNRAVLFDPTVTPQNGIGSKYARPSGYKTEPYWALNLLEEMDQPGEWAVDFNRKRIYFYAPGPVTNGNVVISDLGVPLVQIGGNNGAAISNVVFRSLAFEAGLAQGIVISNGFRNLVVGCAFRNMGNVPVEISNGGTNGVVSCDMTDLAGGGVLLRGGTESTNSALRVPTRNFAVNNIITNFSRVPRVYAAAVDAGYQGAGGAGGGGGHVACVGTRVAHNNISVSPHAAVLHGSWDNFFEYNDISDFQQVSDDLGAFYSYDYTYQHGNQTFRYNFIHDSPHGNGIDFDQDSLNMHIYGNVMNLNTYASESQGYGVVYHDYNQDVSGREQYVDNYNNLYANTHVGAKYVSPLPAVIQNNAAIFCTTSFTWELVTLGVTSNTLSTSSQSVMQSGPNTNYLVDPGFLSLTNNDMRLKPDSRVYSDLPTFKQIPVELIGLYNDEFRTNAGGYSPFITTSNILAYTATNALCGGRLYFPQFESNTTVIVYYGHTDGGTNPAAWQASTNFGLFAASALSSLVSGLDPYTTYYFRHFATNAFGSSWSTASVGINLPPPPAGAVFVNLTPNLAVLTNSLVMLSGEVVGAGPSFPTNGEVITVTVNGVTQSGTVTNNSGNFAVIFNTAGIPPSVVPYPVTYAYAGTTNIGATTNTTTTLTIMPGSIIWSGSSDTDFENGGAGGNWSDYPAPLNDLVSDLAIFGSSPTANQPSLTASRAVKGLTFNSTNGGWTLSSGSTNFVLGLGAGGIVSSAQTNGVNVINANLNVGMNQTWQVGNGGSLLFSGSISNATASTNYSVIFNLGGANGSVVLNPSAGNNVSLIGTNGAPVMQLTTGGRLQLGGDGISTPATTSTNYVVNRAGGYGSLKLTGASSKVQVNSGTWNFGDFSRNSPGDALSGILEINGGSVIFAGARYIGGGTININNDGVLKSANTNFMISNGGLFQLGGIGTGTAIMNVRGGLVDLASSSIVGNVGNGIGAATSALLNQSGGVLQNAVTTGGGASTSFSIGGLPYANGTTNNLSAFTLTGGTFICAGTLLGGTNAANGSLNNFNFMGGVLAVQSVNATNLGSSPTATATANQTAVSLAIGTLANYGGTLAPGNLGIPGKTMVMGNYAISNEVAVLAIDIGGTNQASAFQNSTTNYDFVSVAGNTMLGGGLSVNLLNNFTPAATNSFVILTNGGSLSGAFTNIIAGRVAVSNLPGGSFRVLTNLTSVVLTNFVLLGASFTAISNSGSAPLTVTFTDTSSGLITNRLWNFGDGSTTNTSATTITHTFTNVGSNLVTLIVSDVLASSTSSQTVQVSAVSVPPIFDGVNVSGTNVILSGTNGTEGASYFVLATTNLSLPLANWPVIATNQFGPGGGFVFTNAMSPGTDCQFFQIKLP